MGGNEAVIGGTLPQRMHSCLATLDYCLQANDHSVISSVVRADHKTEASGKKGSLMKTIAHILGLKDYASLDASVTLGELGMDSLMSVEVKQTLERDYDCVLSMEDIRRLTVRRIAAIDQQNHDNNNGDKSCQSFSSQDSPVNDFTFTVATDSVEYINEGKTGRPVILLPPLDGSYGLLNDLVAAIDRPVIGLNWTHDCGPLVTIEDTARHYLNVIDEKLKNLGNDYDLMGYSFGGCVAYEMAVLLQQRPQQLSADTRLILLDSSPVQFGIYADEVMKKLILLDSSPVQFGIYADEVMKKYQLSDHKSQELETLMTFLAQYVSVDYKSVRETLEKTPAEERVEKVSQIFLSSMRKNMDQMNGVTEESVEFIAKSFSNKLLMLNTYSVCNKQRFGGENGVKFANDLLLIRAEDNIVNNKDLIKHDYGLSQTSLM
ncbi:unnamed protein product [Medioppia subpectinata]|uniref:Fatty acid synthase n=1 Tax=Medioppia subpectinata TaxID=1979941 RepID=A0A7R9PXZ1_9ACAR|nr:unnamed protein product [Medioppia subpectinata]CAG2105327.1 unnamed protein product [Medioppia subpectinata]